MRDESLVEPIGVEEIYVDGFADHAVIGDGNVMTCLGYRTHARRKGEDVKIARVRLIWPTAATEEAIAGAREAQSAPPRVRVSQRDKRH